MNVLFNNLWGILARISGFGSSWKRKIRNATLACFRQFLFGTFIIIGIGFGSNVHAGVVLWSVEQGGNGHWYERVQKGSQITWQNANTEAMGMKYLETQGYLAGISSAAENLWVYNTFIIDTASVWFGGVQDVGGGSWRWVNGETWEYSNWASGQPDGYLGYPEHTLYYLGNQAWDDAPDAWSEIPSGFLVEYTPVPEPTSKGLILLAIAGLALWRVGAGRSLRSEL